eukprot:366551-Chlamydomonas_euryale.AAC.17
MRPQEKNGGLTPCTLLPGLVGALTAASDELDVALSMRIFVQDANQLALFLLELAHGLGLDLAHPLARHVEVQANVLQRHLLLALQPKAQPDDAGLALGQRAEDGREVTPQHHLVKHDVGR